MVDKFNDNTYDYLMAPEFIPFTVTIFIKILLFISTCWTIYQFLHNLCRFIMHYINLRDKHSSEPKNDCKSDNDETKYDPYKGMRRFG